MPKESGSTSGTNSQGNHYNTPGGTNSSSGNSYHCKLPRILRIPTKLPHSIVAVLSSSFLLFLQIPTPMDRTTTRTTMEVLTTIREMEAPTTPLPASKMTRAYPSSHQNSWMTPRHTKNSRLHACVICVHHTYIMPIAP